MWFHPATGRIYREQSRIGVFESRVWKGYLHLKWRHMQEGEEDCILRIFKICTLNYTLLGWPEWGM
jgi:hypothetical protein